MVRFEVRNNDAVFPAKNAPGNVMSKPVELDEESGLYFWESEYCVKTWQEKNNRQTGLCPYPTIRKDVYKTIHYFIPVYIDEEENIYVQHQYSTEPHLKIQENNEDCGNSIDLICPDGAAAFCALI